MAGTFEAGDGLRVAIAVAGVKKTPHGAKGIHRVAVEAFPMTMTKDVDMGLELLAMRLEDLRPLIELLPDRVGWSGVRPERGLWLGAPLAENVMLRELGRAAGVDLVAVSPGSGARKRPTGFFGDTVDVVIAWVPGMDTTHRTILKEAERRKLPIIELAEPDLAGAVQEGRRWLHGCVRDRIARHAEAEAEKERTVAKASQPPASRYGTSGHARERCAKWDYSPSEVQDALGHPSVRPPRAKRGMAPTHGSPLEIGTQAPVDKNRLRHVLLAVLESGRRAHVTVDRADALIVTLWDPDHEDNVTFWQHDRLGPTKEGKRRMPPTIWTFDPED